MTSLFDRIRKALHAKEPSSQPVAEFELLPDLVRFACVTNTGHRRLHNEDNYYFFGSFEPAEHQSLDEPLSRDVPLGERACVAIFDGMGGELAGEAASYAAATWLAEHEAQLEYDLDSLASAFAAMQGVVSEVRTSQKLSSIGTTASVLMTDGATALVGNLGDSPIFLMRGGDLQFISVAHTDEVLLRELGLHRKAGLTQYLGMDDSDAPIEPHLASLELEPGDVLLLASDGLTDMVDQMTTADVLGSAQNPAEMVSRLCTLALEAGGKDNITIIACQVPAR